MSSDLMADWAIQAARATATTATVITTGFGPAWLAQRYDTTDNSIDPRQQHHRQYSQQHHADATTPMVPDSDLNESADMINNELVQIFFCILYSTVFVLGVFGNVLVCYVVLRNRAMQTVTNIFITNLALSDILLCVLAVPFTPLYTFMGRWAFGRTLCHLVSFAQGCSIYISTLTLTSIAIDRYFVIIYPFHPRMKLSTCIAIIVSIWVVSLLATLPYGMYMKVVSDAALNGTLATPAYPTAASGSNGTASPPTRNATYGAQRSYDAYMQVLSTATAATDDSHPSHSPASDTATSTTCYCEENWPSEQYRKVFGSVTTILQFVLPFVIISICYIWISLKLNERARAKPGTKSSRREEADRDRKKRTNRMLIAMVAVFGLSWLPLNVVNIFDDFYEKSNEWRFYTLFFFVAHSIAMSSTCYNPFLYAWLNENFRKEFKHVLPCFNPSNNNIISITRAYNRSDRNTCGPRLHHGNGGGALATDRTADSIDIDDNDDNAITQDTCLPKDNLLIIPREPTYGGAGGSGSAGGAAAGGAISPRLDRGRCGGVNAALIECNRQVEILLNDNEIHRGRRRHDEEDVEMDSGDDQMIDVRFSETPFISSDNTTSGVSPLEVSTSFEVKRSGGTERDVPCN